MVHFLRTEWEVAKHARNQHGAADANGFRQLAEAHQPLGADSFLGTIGSCVQISCGPERGRCVPNSHHRQLLDEMERLLAIGFAAVAEIQRVITGSQVLVSTGN